MTCQWCKYYRRRGGTSLCLVPGGDGKIIAVVSKEDVCPKFTARKSCTTCGRRCTPDEKDTLTNNPEGCPNWELRVLSSWGGSRRFVRNHQNDVNN